jgi:hypothetical protein
MGKAIQFLVVFILIAAAFKYYERGSVTACELPFVKLVTGPCEGKVSPTPAASNPVELNSLTDRVDRQIQNNLRAPEMTMPLDSKPPKPCDGAYYATTHQQECLYP